MKIPNNCQRCNKWVRYPALDLKDLKTVYQYHGVVYLCSSCGKGADKFVNYFGHKSKQDIDNVRNFINTGELLVNKFSAQMNAGYF